MPARPGRSGKLGWVRSRAWTWVLFVEAEHCGPFGRAHVQGHDVHELGLEGRVGGQPTAPTPGDQPPRSPTPQPCPPYATIGHYFNDRTLVNWWWDFSLSTDLVWIDEPPLNDEKGTVGISIGIRLERYRNEPSRLRRILYTSTETSPPQYSISDLMEMAIGESPGEEESARDSVVVVASRNVSFAGIMIPR